MSKRFLTPPNLPSGSSLPAAGIAGDLFFKSDEAKIYVHDGTEWVIAQGSGGTGGGVVVSDTPPVDPESGTYWFDSTTTKSYIYYDSFWIEIGTTGGGYIVSDTAPSSASEGDAWFDTTEGVIYVYYDGFWVDPTTGGAAGVPAGGTTGQILAKVDGEDYNTAWVDLEAQNVGVDTTSFSNTLGATDNTVQAALETLDALSAGGASVTVSDTAPAGPEEGDTWFNSTTGILYIYYDSVWVDTSGGGVSAEYVQNQIAAVEAKIDNLISPFLLMGA